PGSYVIVAYEEREGVMTGKARQKVEIGGESIESLTISLGSGATFQGRVTVSGPGSLTSDRISVALSPVDEDEQLGGHGRVKKEGSEAMIGAHVRITPDPETPYNPFRSRSAKTDQTGNFSITGLAPGEYRVFASYPASPRSGSLKSDAQLVTLSEHAHKTVQLVMVKPQAE